MPGGKAYPPAPVTNSFRARFALLVRQASFLGGAIAVAAAFFQLTDGSWKPAIEALSAPFLFGARNLRIGDPAGFFAFFVGCAAVSALLGSWWRPQSVLGYTWGWALLPHLLLGNLLLWTGALAGTGYRLSVPYEGTYEAPPLVAPCEACVLHGFRTGSVETWGWSIVDGARGRLSLPAWSWLFVHPEHGPILIDAGVSPSVATDAAAHVGPLRWHLGALRIEQPLGADARTAIARSGFDPAGIRTILLTHLHPDHAGGIEQFPGVRVLIGEADAPSLDAPTFPLIEAELDGPIDFQTIPLRDERVGPWAQSVDLFGDGSMRIVATPGHTPGHHSVLLALPEGPVLLAGDSAQTEQNLRTGSVGLRAPYVDHLAWREALGALQRFQKEATDVMILPGHDVGPVRRARRPDIQLHEDR